MPVASLAVAMDRTYRPRGSKGAALLILAAAGTVTVGSVLILGREPVTLPTSIEGLWAPTCPEMSGTIVAIHRTAPDRARGWISTLGTASRVGYRHGQVVLELWATARGDWEGVVAAERRDTRRWDHAWFEVRRGLLRSTVEEEPCFRHFKRKE